jgi:NADH:ubiquinone oxidoreductase subunit F (NADH-binding)
VTAVHDVLTYLDRENANQCGPCFKGIPSMASVVGALTRCQATAEDVERLATWSRTLRGRGACGTLDAACQVSASLLEQHGRVVAAHRAAPCARCAGRTHGTRGTAFAVPWPARIEEES